MDTFKKELTKAGITNEFLLEKTEELINATENGEFKPRNKQKELDKLFRWKKECISRIENNIA